MISVISNISCEEPPRPTQKATFKSVTKPAKTLPTIENDIRTEAFKILRYSLHFLSYFGYLCGYNISYNWTYNPRFVMTKSLTYFIWTQFIYTQVLYVHQGNTVRIWEVFAIYGIGISGALKIRLMEKYHTNFRALFDATLRICQQSTGLRGDRLKRSLDANLTFYKLIVLLGLATVVIYVFYPVKSALIDGVLVPFVPVELIFVDQSTMWGYLTANILFVVLGILAATGSLYVGLVFVYLISNYGLLVDILEVDVYELNELWNDTSTSTLANRHSFLQNMCKKFIDMRDYVNAIKYVFDNKLFIFFTFGYLSQILCIYQVRVNNWIPGYALAIGFSMEMIFYCIMGTRLVIENERLLFIFTQSKWYTYDLTSQKLMLTLLNSILNSDELWIGPIAPLSVFTGSEIFKSIYSYYTVMTEVM